MKAPEAAAPSERSPQPAPAGRASAGAGLRLALGRDGLGFELSSAAQVGFAIISAFRVALPRGAAPLEIRGGLSSFSAAHGARGTLVDLEVRVPAPAFEAWARERAARLLGTSTLHLTWGDAEAHLGFTRVFCGFNGGFNGRHLEWGRASFDVAADGSDIVVLLRDASGEAGGTSARALALLVMREALRGLASPDGCEEGRFVVAGAIRRAARAVLGRAGLRTPRLEGRGWNALRRQGDALVFTLEQPSLERSGHETPRGAVAPSPRSTPLPPTTARSIRAPAAPAWAAPPPVLPAERALRELLDTLGRMLSSGAPLDRAALVAALAEAEAAGLGPRSTDPRPPPLLAAPPTSPLDAAATEARVEALIRHLQQDPSRDDVADELTERLLGLGRGLELLALLSARVDEAAPARREALLPRKRAVLAQLASEARRDGRADDAAIFSEALARSS